MSAAAESWSWPQVREEAIERFQAMPTAETEAVVIEAFERRPRLVIRAISEVGAEVEAGKARSGWAVLKSRCEGAANPALSDVTVTDTSEREKLIGQARRWVMNAGVHFDRESEVEEQLFGDFGILRVYPDATLRAELLAQWAETRPRGERSEQEAIERAETWKAQQAKIRSMKRATAGS